MQKWHHKQSKKYVSKVSVGFVKCHEWRVVCYRPTLVCPRIIAAAIAFEVALQVASLARSVFMTSQLYQRLSALSVLSGYCGVVNACRLPLVIRYYTILMLFWSTLALGDRAMACVVAARPAAVPIHLSISDLPPPSFTAELNGPCVLGRIHTMWRRFGGRSAGSSVPSPSQLDRDRTRFSTKIGSITIRETSWTSLQVNVTAQGQNHFPVFKMYMTSY